MTDRKCSAMPNKIHAVLTEQLKAFDSKKEVFMTLSNDKTALRSAVQNKLVHCYYRMIAEEMGDISDDIEARCKRKFGISLMREQAEGTTKMANKVYIELVKFGIMATDSPAEKKIVLLRFNDLVKEGQVEAMKSIQCTRNFGIKMMCRYMEKIEIWAAMEFNLTLESIKDKLKREGL